MWSDRPAPLYPRVFNRRSHTPRIQRVARLRQRPEPGRSGMGTNWELPRLWGTHTLLRGWVVAGPSVWQRIGLGTNLFSLFGLGLIVVGLFVTDPPGGPQTFHGTVHNYVTPLVFLSVVAACFVLARRFAGDPTWKGWATYSIVTGVLVVVCLRAINLVSLLDHQASPLGAPIGLLQRTAIVIGWGSIRALLVSAPSKRPSSLFVHRDHGETDARINSLQAKTVG